MSRVTFSRCAGVGCLAQFVSDLGYLGVSTCPKVHFRDRPEENIGIEILNCQPMIYRTQTTSFPLLYTDKSHREGGKVRRMVLGDTETHLGDLHRGRGIDQVVHGTLHTHLGP